MDYPDVFVDEALGFAVGVMYWWGPALACLSQSLLIGEKRLANCISMVTLTIAAAMFTQYWGPGFGVAPATFILLLVIVLMNACGVRVRFRLTLGKGMCLTMVDLWEFRMDFQMGQDPVDFSHLYFHDCDQSWG